jgi:hypothetical protein
MKKIVPALLLTAVCFACGQSDKKEPVKSAPLKAAHASNKAPLFTYGNPVLLQYDRYISGLDTQLVEMSSQAVDTFKMLFKNQPATVCDTALYIFKNFHSSLSTYLYLNMEADSVNYEQIHYKKDENGKPYKLSPKQLARKRALDKNGFNLASSEGQLFIDPDHGFIFEQFAKYVSEPMRNYLGQVNLEQMEGFEEDAGLTISPKVLADRAIWWENFSRSIENTHFLYAEEVADKYRYILHTLMEGMDNTSIVDLNTAGDSSVPKVSEYFSIAWTYLGEQYPNAKATRLVTPLLSAFQKNDTAEVSRVLERFKKEYKPVYE